MSSIDASQVAELVTNVGYGVMFEMYEAQELVFPQFCEVVDAETTFSPFYGDKGAVIQRVESHKEREDGQPVEASTMNSAWTWRMKIRQYSRSIIIPGRMLRANNALAVVSRRIQEAAQFWGEDARLQKDDYVAGILQKGTLTAGSTEYFDNSFPGETDPNRGFIFDGLPFFDGAHTLSADSSTYSNIATSQPLNSANVQAVYTTMAQTNAVDERGRRIDIRPNVVVVPAALQFTAKKVLGDPILSGANNNESNPAAGLLETIIMPALTDDADAWFTGCRGKGIRVADSGAPTLRTIVHANGDVEIVSEYHFGAAVTNWRYWHASNKADS